MGIGGQGRSPALAQYQCQGAEVVPAVAEGQGFRHSVRQGFGGTGQAQVLRPPGSPLRGGGEQFPDAIGSMGRIAAGERIPRQPMRESRVPAQQKSPSPAVEYAGNANSRLSGVWKHRSEQSRSRTECAGNLPES